MMDKPQTWLFFVLIISFILLGMFIQKYTNTFSISQPNLMSVEEMSLVLQPEAPSTDVPDSEYGVCTDWDIKDETCSGNIRQYSQCQKTVSGGVWVSHNEDCTQYGENVVCSLGQCVKETEKSTNTFLIIIAVAVVLFIFFKRK